MLSFRKPAPDLASQVAAFWSFPCVTQPAPAAYEVYPDCGAGLVIAFSSSGCRLALSLSTQRAQFEPVAGTEYFGVRFHPGHTPLLAALCPRDLIDASVELSQLGGLSLDDLAERFLRCPEFESRQALVEHLLRGTPPLARDWRARRAAFLLDRNGGRMRVEELASALGLHVRTLERILLEHLGISPKPLARLVRFRHVLARLQGDLRADLAGVAAEFGYADQPHLTRDFKELTGYSPGEQVARGFLRPASPERGPSRSVCAGRA